MFDTKEIRELFRSEYRVILIFVLIFVVLAQVMFFFRWEIAPSPTPSETIFIVIGILISSLIGSLISILISIVVWAYIGSFGIVFILTALFFCVIIAPLGLQAYWVTKVVNRVEKVFVSSYSEYIKYDPFEKQESAEEDHSHIVGSKNVIVFYITNKKINFELGKKILGKDLKFPRNPLEVEYVVYIKDTPELFNVVRTGNIFLAFLGLDKGKICHLYRVDRNIAIVNWRSKMVIAGPRTFKGHIPSIIRASDVDGDTYYYPFDDDICEWVKNKLVQ